jgi:hypothetical protein
MLNEKSEILYAHIEKKLDAKIKAIQRLQKRERVQGINSFERPQRLKDCVTGYSWITCEEWLKVKKVMRKIKRWEEQVT